MEQNTSEYRLWLKRRNEKNLRRRTKRKKAKQGTLSKKSDYDSILRQNENYSQQDNTMRFPAPPNFSIIDNPEETINFFSRLIQFVNNKKNFGRNLTIYIDIAGVDYLTKDALMYLLAVINDLDDQIKRNFTFKGNEPKDTLVRKTFKESGFYKYVYYRGKEPLKRNRDNLQILSGEESDGSLTKQIIDFVCEKTLCERKRKCSFLYNMLSELMSNTHDHAYNTSKHILKPRWYCSVEYDKEAHFIFTFLDTGEGIPATVQKRGLEYIDLMGFKEDYKYVTSAMDAENRTSTHLPYRGKGLPRIRKMCSDSLISNIHIITNKANVIVKAIDYDGGDLSTSLQGTLYTWSLDSKTLQENEYGN